MATFKTCPADQAERIKQVISNDFPPKVVVQSLDELSALTKGDLEKVYQPWRTITAALFLVLLDRGFA